MGTYALPGDDLVCSECGFFHAASRPHPLSLAAQRERDRRRHLLRQSELREADPVGFKVHQWALGQAQRGIPADPEAIAYARILLNDPCSYCGSRTDIEIDHITSRSQGGKTTAENLTAVCHACNGHKGAGGILRAVHRVQQKLLRRLPLTAFAKEASL